MADRRAALRFLFVSLMALFIHAAKEDFVLKTGIKTFHVNKRPNMEVDGFPVIDEIFTSKDLVDFVNQSYSNNQVGGGIVGVFNAKIDDLSKVLESERQTSKQAFDDEIPLALYLFVQLAYELRNQGFRFGLSTSDQLVKRLGDKPYCVYVYKPPKYVSSEFGETTVQRYTEENPTFDELRSFVLQHSMPLVGRVTEDNEMQYVTQDLPVFLLILDPLDLLNFKLLETYRAYAARYVDTAKFAVVGKMEAHMILKYYRTDVLGYNEDDVLEDDFKAFACFVATSERAFRLGQDEITSQNVAMFIERVLNGDEHPGDVEEGPPQYEPKEEL